jgi:hypothetical protein
VSRASPGIPLVDLIGDDAVDIETVRLHRSEQCGEVTGDTALCSRRGATVDGIAGRGGVDRDGIGPTGGLVGAEENGGVKGARDGVLDQWFDVLPDTELGIVEHRFRNRNNGGDFLHVQVLVRPRHLGGLLETGVAGDEIRDRQGAQHRHAGLVGRHADLPKHGQRGGLVGQPGENVIADLLRDEGLDVGTPKLIVVRDGNHFLLLVPRGGER